MTRLTLPNSSLIRIFSLLSSSKSTLYNVSLSSRTLLQLAKPFLYHHITINTIGDYKGLLNVTKENAKLVKKVTIKGTQRRLRRIGDSRFVDTECVVALMRGKLLDISVIEVLHVADIFGEVDLDFASLKLKKASKLEELSISGHFGGADLWAKFLENEQLCPRLVRLGIFCVTVERERDIDSSDSDLETAEEEDFLEDADLTLTDPSLYSRLEIVAMDRKTGLVSGDYGLKDLFVVTTIEWNSDQSVSSLLQQHTNVQLVVQGRPLDPDQYDFQSQLDKLRKSPPIRTTFLSLPWSPLQLSPGIRDVLSAFADLNVEVHYSDEEEEDSISLIPQSFVEFARRQKKKKQEEGKVEA